MSMTSVLLPEKGQNGVLNTESFFLEKKRARQGLTGTRRVCRASDAAPGRPPYPGALASYQLIIFRLDACPASDVEIFCLKVGVVQLLRGLPTKKEIMSQT